MLYRLTILMIDGDFDERPIHREGIAKYCGYRDGNIGLYTPQSFGELAITNPHLTEVLTMAANNSLAVSSWRSYRTVQKHLIGCEKHYGNKFTFPMQSDQTLMFIAYLFEDRGVQAKTASKYISALRTLHLVRGHSEPSLRSGIVKAVLKGKSNIDEESRRFDPKHIRLPVTMDVLKLLKLTIEMSNWPEIKKALIEAVSLLCFFGGKKKCINCIKLLLKYHFN